MPRTVAIWSVKSPGGWNHDEEEGRCVLALLAAFPVAALAQKPVKRAETSEVTAKVEAIDHTDPS